LQRPANRIAAGVRPEGARGHEAAERGERQYVNRPCVNAKIFVVAVVRVILRWAAMLCTLTRLSALTARRKRFSHAVSKKRTTINLELNVGFIFEISPPIVPFVRVSLATTHALSRRYGGLL
jgi:hypothetical protein